MVAPAATSKGTATSSGGASSRDAAASSTSRLVTGGSASTGNGGTSSASSLRDELNEETKISPSTSPVAADGSGAPVCSLPTSTTPGENGASPEYGSAWAP